MQLLFKDFSNVKLQNAGHYIKLQNKKKLFNIEIKQRLMVKLIQDKSNQARK